MFVNNNSKIYLKVIVILTLFLSSFHPASFCQSKGELIVKGTQFFMNDNPFVYNGVSFFNAIYNPEFNRNDSTRNYWLKKFRNYGVHVIRVWGQWDNERGFVDASDECTLYDMNGNINKKYLLILRNIAKSASDLNMVIELSLFSRESWEEDIRLPKDSYLKAAVSLATQLKDLRNITFQIWNEHSMYIPEIYNAIKSVDPHRLVTNSPGYGGVLGDREQNELLDFLTPHTSRHDKHWDLAPAEIRQLLETYHKPVVDDEPARTGTIKYGGPKGDNFPTDFIIHMYNVRKAGGYVFYHHDMFQTGYGSEAVPPSGIPDPEFRLFHQHAFEFLSLIERYK